MVNDNRLFYASNEMANKCGVHPGTWCRWVKDGKAPEADLEINGCPRWSKELIEAWMNSNRKSRKQSLNNAVKKRI